MTDDEQEKFEVRLRRIEPAKPPEEFIARLLAAEPNPKVESPTPASSSLGYLLVLRRSLRWLIPATAVALTAALIWREGLPSINRQASPAANPAGRAASAPEVIKADDVQIDQELISSFDAVARLPGGEPVRFRFQQWMDQVVLSDTEHGLVVESRTPRVEVVAVGFETY